MQLFLNNFIKLIYFFILLNVKEDLNIFHTIRLVLQFISKLIIELIKR